MEQRRSPRIAWRYAAGVLLLLIVIAGVIDSGLRISNTLLIWRPVGQTPDPREFVEDVLSGFVPLDLVYVSFHEDRFAAVPVPKWRVSVRVFTPLLTLWAFLTPLV